MDSVTVNIDDVMRMFREFDRRKINRVYKQATKKALGIIRQEVVSNLRKVTKKINRKDKWGMTLRKGIVTNVYRDNKSGVIHIMKNFKLKFFELGTKDRYNVSKGSRRTGRLKKKRYTGKITASHFFMNAVNAKKTEAYRNMEQLISESIQKINNKYAKK